MKHVSVGWSKQHLFACIFPPPTPEPNGLAAWGWKRDFCQPHFLNSSSLPVLPPVCLKSIVKKHCSVGSTWTLWCLVSFRCWSKKWPNSSKDEHGLDSDSDPSLFSYGWKLSPSSVRALQSKQLDPSICLCSPVSTHECMNQRIWAGATWHRLVLVWCPCPLCGRAAQLEAQLYNKILPICQCTIYCLTTDNQVRMRFCMIWCKANIWFAENPSLVWVIWKLLLSQLTRIRRKVFLWEVNHELVETPLLGCQCDLGKTSWHLIQALLSLNWAMCSNLCNHCSSLPCQRSVRDCLLP